MKHSKKGICFQTIVCTAVLFFCVFGAFGQEFSIDEDPSAPITPVVVTSFRSAEDQFGLGLPPALAGLLAPSPSLALGLWGSDVLAAGPIVVFPMPPLTYVYSISANHGRMKPQRYPTIGLRFSIDRATGGAIGSAAAAETACNQQPGDLYDGTLAYQHPGLVTVPATPLAPPFGGVLSTAWPLGGGSNREIRLPPRILKPPGGGK